MNELDAALKLLAWMLVDGQSGALFILLTIAAVSDYRTLRCGNITVKRYFQISSVSDRRIGARLSENLTNLQLENRPQLHRLVF